MNKNRKCKYCGRMFDPHLSQKQFCSRRCRGSWLRFGPHKRSTPKHCVQCGKTFLPFGTKHILCSPECRKARNREKFLALKSGLAKGEGWLSLRFQVFERDSFTCQYCGRNVWNDKIKLECDHIKPRKKLGPLMVSKSELVTACWECNHGKYDFCLSERNRLKLKEAIKK